MSTRGCVAWKTENGWRGVYNHYDSYPEGLGNDIFNKISLLVDGTPDSLFIVDNIIPIDIKKKKIEKAMNFIVDTLKQCSDWRELESGGICKYCGKKGQPHTISIFLDVVETNEIFNTFLKKNIDYKPKNYTEETIINIFKTGYPDPEIKYHKHNSANVDEEQILSDKSDPLFIEYVYVLIPEEARIEVWTHQGFPVKLKQFYSIDGSKTFIINNNPSVISAITKVVSEKEKISYQEAKEKVINNIETVEETEVNDKYRKTIEDLIKAEGITEVLPWKNYGHCEYRHIKTAVIDIMAINDSAKFFEKVAEDENELHEKLYNNIKEKLNL